MDEIDSRYSNADLLARLRTTRSTRNRLETGSLSNRYDFALERPDLLTEAALSGVEVPFGEAHPILASLPARTAKNVKSGLLLALATGVPMFLGGAGSMASSDPTDWDAAAWRTALIGGGVGGGLALPFALKLRAKANRRILRNRLMAREDLLTGLLRSRGLSKQENTYAGQV